MFITPAVKEVLCVFLKHFNQMWSLITVGASVYLVNCSQDEAVCKQQGITGYPSLVAYRSLLWLDGEQCLSEETSKSERYVRLDYHGVLMVGYVLIHVCMHKHTHKHMQECTSTHTHKHTCRHAQAETDSVGNKAALALPIVYNYASFALCFIYIF